MSDDEPQEIDVNVDVKGLGEVVKDAWKTKSVNRAIKQIVTDANTFGVTKPDGTAYTPEDITCEDDIRGLSRSVQERKLSLASQKREIEVQHHPSGSVPLTQAQYEGYEGEGYDSYAELFKHLQVQSKSTDKTVSAKAKNQLDLLTVKAMKALKDKAEKIDINIPSDQDLEKGLGLLDVMRAERKKRKEIEDEN